MFKDEDMMEWFAERVSHFTLKKAISERDRYLREYHNKREYPNEVGKAYQQRYLALRGFWIGYLTYHIQVLERQEEIKVNRASIIEA